MMVLHSQPSAMALFHRPCPETCPLSLAKQGAPLHQPAEVRIYASAPGLLCLLVVPPPLLGPISLSGGPRGSLTPISQDRLTHPEKGRDLLKTTQLEPFINSCHVSCGLLSCFQRQSKTWCTARQTSTSEASHIQFHPIP